MSALPLPEYRRPDLGRIEAEHGALSDELARAGRGEVVGVVAQWNEARIRLDTLRSTASLRYQQDTRDAAARAEQAFWNEAAPLLRELDALFARALLESPHREAIESAFGPELIRLKSSDAANFAPEIRSALAEEAKLVTEYTELTARQEIEFRGERHTLGTISRWFADSDRSTRLEAQMARDTFLGRRGTDLDRIYARLVELRDGMGRALGLGGFTPLGYRLMNRTEYGPNDVAIFRDEIRRDVVPLVSDILASRARRMGLSTLFFHDEPAGDPVGNPRPAGNSKFCIAAASEMFRDLGPEFAEFFEVMIEKKLLDLDYRPGKASAAFCTQLASVGLPFVFANFDGTDSDVAVLLHECGHAFQCWRSRRHPLVEYRFPTSEGCEIHSMAMEYLAKPSYDRFFGDAAKAARARRIHLEADIVFLPYMAAIDHFQHVVYENPRLSAEERCDAWLEMERLYLPHRNYGGHFPNLQRGRYFQRQLHVYVYPFYYIDYALAQTCALQIWRRSNENRAAALRDYLALCDTGGSASFLELVKIGNLRSPFEPGCLRDVVTGVRQELGL